ncbi:unnamed protein product [Symbiodinium sp. CCMP2456]|nr:unnamed protein product [Symbiodinium sp. CCMP2456]
MSDPESAFLVELWTGSGTLPAAAHKAGFASAAIDPAGKCFKAKSVALDPEVPEDMALIFDLLQQPGNKWCHVNLPRQTVARKSFRAGDAVARLLRDMDSRGGLWSVWMMEWGAKWCNGKLRATIASASTIQVDCCMWGGSDKRRMVLASNRQWFLRLARTCDGSHEHYRPKPAPGQARAEWPPALAPAAVACVVNQMPEACSVRHASEDRNKCSPFAATLSPLPGGVRPWPKGTVLKSINSTFTEAKLAVPISAPEWCLRASRLVAPEGMEAALPSDLLHCVEQETTQTVFDLSKIRVAKLRALLQDLAAGHAEEQALPDTLPAEVARVTAGKCTVALKKTLERLGHRDSRCADEIREGFPLVGWLPPSGLWKMDLKPPVVPPCVLLAHQKRLTEKSREAALHSAGAHLAPQVWRETSAEESKGWLSLICKEEARVVSPRFGITQKNKIRVIDNFKASLVNAACGTTEKIQVDGVDRVISLCRALLRAKPSSQRRIVGRTWDLQSAYKQLAVRDADKAFAHICLRDEEGALRFAQLHALPFGSVASVHPFLRCSEAIKCVARRALLLAITSFFDDFTVVTSSEAAALVSQLVESLFRALGWTVATDAKNNSPFSEKFSAP